MLSFPSAPPDTAKLNGANLSHPSRRHREAPMQKVLQAAPSWARARSASAWKNSRFFEKAVAEATLKFFVLFCVVFLIFTEPRQGYPSCKHICKHATFRIERLNQQRITSLPMSRMQPSQGSLRRRTGFGSLHATTSFTELVPCAGAKQCEGCSGWSRK